MASQPEQATYDATVYQIQTTDAVVGGPGGIANMPLLNLANRTGWLKNQLSALATSIAGAASLAGAVFSGPTQVPNVAVGDRSQNASNTNFVSGAIDSVVTISVAGNSNVALTQPQWGAAVIELTGQLTGNINVIFPAQVDNWLVLNSTTGAGNSGPYTVNCQTAAGSGVVVQQGLSRKIWCDGTNVYPEMTDFSALAHRTVVSAPLTLYVANSGSDTVNTGLSSTSPFATLQHAINVLYSSYDMNGYTPSIQLAAGTYGSGYVQGLPLGAPQNGGPALSIIGNTAAPSSVVINGTTASAITASGASLFVNGVTLESSYSAGCGMAAQSGANVTIGGAVVFGACTIAQMQSVSAALISATAGYSITGGGQNHLIADGGSIQVIGGTVTISGTPNYSQSFALAEGGGTIVSYNVTWSGSATGVKFQASALGAFEVAGSGVNYFPGNSAGVVGDPASYG